MDQSLAVLLTIITAATPLLLAAMGELVVERSGVLAHPADLGISEADFRRCLLDLDGYTRAEGLDMTVADLQPITTAQADAAWKCVQTLPRHDGGGGR